MSEDAENMSRNMHREILTPEQQELLPFVSSFKDTFGLVGGTAIAIQIGHRESIDFDLFSFDEFDSSKIRRVFSSKGKKINVIRAWTGQLTFTVDDVHMTFFHFPYHIEYSESFEDIAKIPDLLTFAAMKAFALGQRSKWKDCVDMYFILREGYSLEDIVQKADSLFSSEFNGKLFRQQLSYFDDINYTETVNFRPGFDVTDEEVKRALVDAALS
jgi:hypothetical protein